MAEVRVKQAALPWEAWECKPVSNAYKLCTPAPVMVTTRDNKG